MQLQNLSDFNQMTDKDLFDLIASAVHSVEGGVWTVCRALVVLRDRKIAHPLMGHPLYVKFPLLGEGKVTPRAYIKFVTTPSALEGLVGVSHEMQDRLANDEPLPCVTRNAEGRIIFENKPVIRMEEAVIKRVFGPHGIRSREDQEHILAAEMKKPTKLRVTPHILVDPRREQIEIDRKKVYVEDLREPLRLLGYTLVKTRPAAKAAS